MISPTTVICLGVILLESITGLCSSIFVICTLIFSGYKEKCFAPYAIILIALCVSSVGYTILISANFFMSIVCPSLFIVPYVFYIVSYLSLYSIVSCAWLTCSLCFFYFIKIVQFKPGFFAWVKMKILTIVPWMILTVEFISLAGSFLSLLVYNQESTKNSTMSRSELTSDYDKLRLKFMIPVLTTCSLPLLISISTIAVSARFLKQHSHHIRKNGTASQVNVKEYQSTVQTLSCLIIFYAVMFLFILIFSLPIFDSQSWGFWLCLMVLFSFSLVQSSLLIAGNPKLREAWRQMSTCT